MRGEGKDKGRTVGSGSSPWGGGSGVCTTPPAQVSSMCAPRRLACVLRHICACMYPLCTGPDDLVYPHHFSSVGSPQYTLVCGSPQYPSVCKYVSQYVVSPPDAYHRVGPPTYRTHAVCGSRHVSRARAPHIPQYVFPPPTYTPGRTGTDPHPFCVHSPLHVCGSVRACPLHTCPSPHRAKTSRAESWKTWRARRRPTSGA